MHQLIIRNLYHPVQPTVKQSDQKVQYFEFLPAMALQGFIYCYWQLKTNSMLTENFKYNVVADGCIDIYFNLKQPSESYVMGFCKKYTEFELENCFNYVGVRFLPSMFPQLFKIDAKDLSNKYESLNLITPYLAQYLTDFFDETKQAHEIQQLLDHFFLDVISKSTFNFDARFYNAIKIILDKNGMLNVQKDLNTGMSSRQLRRLFEYYIGDTAKTFSKVVRFQNILKAKPSSQSLKQNKLFFNEGFYDQSHFIKEFKNFYGVTPSKAFGR
jgi:AraC-like DNA-binding protein